ncbi:MAG TPA: hypothetical protein VLV83_24100 [Acidobacteriota bacterium]|nr:hypothetical protein [Acidobacteriota bacterium]
MRKTIYDNKPKANGVPVLNRVGRHLSTLERKIEFLQEQLRVRSKDEGSYAFVQRELEATRAAIVALTYHRAVVSRLDDPIAKLRDLVTACSKSDDGKLRALAKDAQRVLEEFTP